MVTEEVPTIKIGRASGRVVCMHKGGNISTQSFTFDSVHFSPYFRVVIIPVTPLLFRAQNEHRGKDIVQWMRGGGVILYDIQYYT